MSKRTLKNSFFSKRLKIKQHTAKMEADFYMNFNFRSKLFLKVRKLHVVSRSAGPQSCCVPCVC